MSDGTIIVDLERHQPIGLLADRSSATLKTWLLDHQGVEVIARDRASGYALGAKQGAPQAVQVADRFHLLQNLKQLLDRLLTNQYPHLKSLLLEKPTAKPLAPVTPRLLSSIRDISTNEKAAGGAQPVMLVGSDVLKPISRSNNRSAVRCRRPAGRLDKWLEGWISILQR